MSIVAPQVWKHLSADALFRLVHSGFASLPDHRLDDPEISLTDALMSAFAMFSLICAVQEYAECCRAGAKEIPVFGSKYCAYLVTVEQGDQFVGYAKLPAFQGRRYRRVNGFKLLSWISRR